MILKLCAVAIVAAVCGFLLREFGWRGAPVFVIICFIAVLSLAEPYFSQTVSVFNDLSADFGVSEAAEAVMKIVGVGYLAGVSSDICREMGASSVGSAVVLVGRLEIIAIAAPFFFEIVKLGTGLIE